MARPAWCPFDPAELPKLVGVDELAGNTVVVLSTPGAARQGWAIGATVAISDALGAMGRDVIVIDADLDRPSLHLLMEAENAEGVVDLVEFGASRRRVLRDAPDGRFRYMSAGTFAIDPTEVLASAIWQRFCETATAEGATLVIFSETAAPSVRQLLDLATDLVVLANEDDSVDGAVLGYSERVRGVFGPARVAAGEPDAGSQEDAADVVDGSDEGPDAAAESPVASPPPPAVPGTGGASRSTRGPVGSARRVVPITLVLALGAFAVWWFGVRGSPGTDAGDSSLLDGQSERVNVAEAAPEDTGGPDDGPGPDSGVGASPPESPSQDGVIPAGRSATPSNLAESSGRLSYVVQIGSYSDLGDATQKASELWTNNRVGAVVAPVKVSGEPFYRVLIGPVPDSAAAAVEVQRIAGDQSSWLFRYVRLAFHLGEMDDPARALARERELVGMGIPAYTTVVEYEGGSLAYRLYGGAYRNAEEAAGFRAALARMGIDDAPLVPITGLPRLP